MTDSAISLDPKNAKSYYRRGIAYSKLNDTEKAIEALKEACRLAPSDASCRVELDRVIQQDKEKTQKAEQEMREKLKAGL